jgi:sugar (pentulose or hexulose) kinase
MSIPNKYEAALPRVLILQLSFGCGLASVCSRPFVVPEIANPAMGTAVLAASGRLHRNLKDAAQAMVSIAREVQPNPDWVSVYDEHYTQFKQELQKRGYVA